MPLAVVAVVQVFSLRWFCSEITNLDRHFFILFICFLLAVLVLRLCVSQDLVTCLKYSLAFVSYLVSGAAPLCSVTGVALTGCHLCLDTKATPPQF